MILLRLRLGGKWELEKDLHCLLKTQLLDLGSIIHPLLKKDLNMDLESRLALKTKRMCLDQELTNPQIDRSKRWLPLSEWALPQEIQIPNTMFLAQATTMQDQGQVRLHLLMGKICDSRFGSSQRSVERKNGVPGPGHYRVPCRVAEVPKYAMPGASEGFKFV
jgi:hypothetical protein